ncbi:MFS transporter [Actinokineospora enzanensis]|uniref:MFS transporter n=1 Tax=Actinokineospora enzanensis TaxID=155975 RepID=UPI0007C4E89F|nr:MFS transporter [Actinokineospora enzanensis]
MSTTQVDPAATAATTRSPWRVFGLLAVVQFMVVLDAGIVYVALPSIQRQMGFSPAGLVWVMDAYMLAFGGFMLVGGRAADLLGRRRVLLAGLALFALASLACGLSTQPWQLVAARAAQGLGAAIISPAAMALVTDIFPEGPARYKALGMFGGIGGVAGATGTLFGGLLTSIGWQWTFLINVPVILVVLAIGVRALPTGAPHATGGVDVLGAAAGVGGLCVLLFSVLRFGTEGASTSTLLALAVAVVLLGAFVARQLRARSPLMPRMLFRLRNVVLGNLANTAVGALMFGTFLVATLNVQLARELSPLQAAFAIIPVSVALFLGSQVTIRAFGRLNPVDALAAGLVLQALALALWAAVLDPADGIVLSFVVPGVLWGFGLGAAIVAAFVVCTSGLRGEVAGAASGLVSTSLQVGGAIGVAVLGAVANTRTGALAAGGATRPEALSGGHAVALWVTVGIAAVAVPVVVWLRRTWQPPAPHH